MAKEEFLDIPSECPITGEPLYVSELTSATSGVVIRGKFKLPRMTTLPEEHSKFLEVFLRARGVISTMEKELGLSYPTVRARVDALLEAMSLEPLKLDKSSPLSKEARDKILKELEEGKITPEQAKEKLKGKDSA